MSSVPKNDWNACIVALAYAVWPDGWSGYGGVTNAGPAPPIEAGSDGSKSGVQPAAFVVSGLPSVSAFLIAVIGRQNRQWYLSFQVLMIASAAFRSIIANSRALSRVLNDSWSLNLTATPSEFPVDFL